MTVDAPVADLGPTRLGAEGAKVVTLDVGNPNEAPVTLEGVTSSDGAFSADASACGGTIAPRTSCVVSVTFSPTEIGPRSAALEVVTSEVGSTAVELSGTGVALLQVSISTSPQVVVPAGTVTLSGVECSGGCSVPVSSSRVALVANRAFRSPTPGFDFQRTSWSTTCRETATTCNLQVTQDRTIAIAYYQPEPPQIR